MLSCWVLVPSLPLSPLSWSAPKTLDRNHFLSFQLKLACLRKKKKEKQDQQILFGIRVLVEIRAFDQFFCSVPEFDNLPKLLCTWCDYPKNRCGWRRSTSIPDTIPSGSTLQAETSRLDSLPVSLFLRLSSKPPNPSSKMVSSPKIFKMFVAKKF